MARQDMITRSAIHRALEPGEISRRGTLTRRRGHDPAEARNASGTGVRSPTPRRTHIPLSTVSPDAPNGRGSFRRRDHGLRNRRLNWRTGVPALLRHDVLWLRCRRVDVDRNAPSSPRSRDQLSSTPQKPTATARRRKSSERSSPTAVTRSSSARKGLHPTGQDINASGLSRRHIIRGVEASLKRLRTDLAGLLLRPRLRRAHANRADRTRPRRSPQQDPPPAA